MNKIGIGVDYSNICKDYNTVYLDRDNTDPATSKCMKQVLAWTKDFISALLNNFDYSIHSLNSSISVDINDIASKRFLFYSLEKEITLQSYVMQKEYVEYGALSTWESEGEESILIQNDEDGGAIYLFANEDSKALQWIQNRLQNFSLDEAVLETR